MMTTHNDDPAWKEIVRTLKSHVVMRRVLLNAVAAMSEEEFLAERRWGESWAISFGFQLKGDHAWLKRVRGGRAKMPTEGVVYYPTPRALVDAARTIDEQRSKLFLGMTPEQLAKPVSWISAEGKGVTQDVQYVVRGMVEFAAHVMTVIANELRPRDYSFEVSRRLHDLTLFATDVDVVRIAFEQGVLWQEPWRPENAWFVNETRRRMAAVGGWRQVLWSYITRLTDEQFFSITEAMNDSLYHALNRFLAEDSWLMDLIESPQALPAPVESRFVVTRDEIIELWHLSNDRRKRLTEAVTENNILEPTLLYTDPFNTEPLHVVQVFDRMFFPNSFTISGVLRNVGRFGLKEAMLGLFANKGDDTPLRLN